MARRFTLEILMSLAKSIGASPNKFMGTKTNISFLGKGPTKNPLFQGLLPGPETSKVLLGPERIEGTISAVNDAMGYASAGKLNSIQTEMLGKNLLGLKDILHPPPLPTLPMASVTPIRSGIRTLRSNDIGAGPRRYNELTGLNKPRVVDDRGRTWDFKSRVPEPGPGDLAAMTKALDQKTGMSRAIARQILQQDTRLKLNPQELYSLRTGARGEDPLDLMKKYYGESMLKYDDFLNSVNVQAASPAEFAETILKNVRLIPQFARGGLARILEV